MSSMRQIQMRFVPEEDRVLLRLNTTDGEEFRFWITRRYCSLLAQALNAHRAVDPDVATQALPQDRQAVEQFKQQAANASSNFNEDFREDAHFPLGASPILAHKLAYRVEGEKLVLTIEPGDGHGVNITLDQQLNFNFTKLLASAVETAAWGLDLQQMPGFAGENRVVN